MVALGDAKAMICLMKKANHPRRNSRAISLMLGVAVCSCPPAWASSASIKCFRDKQGVLNCTNARPVTHQVAKPSPAVVPPPQPSQVEVTAQPVAPVPTASAAPPSGAAPRQTLVYKYRQRDGVSMFTNVPTSGLQLVSTTVYQVFEKGWVGNAFKGNWKLNREAFAPVIDQFAQMHGVDPAFIRAVMHAESSFNPSAVSRAGAMGLMQLMPGTAARFGVGNAFDPQENIRGGVTYLRFLLDKFNGDTRLAAAGYNAGEGAVMKYGGVPPYAETTEYVARVLDLHQQYRKSP